VPGYLDHVDQASDWALDLIMPSQFNESVLWEDMKKIHASLTNSDIGHLEKATRVSLVLLTIADHHPGFFAIFSLNIAIAVLLPFAGFCFCICRLCGKCDSSSKLNKCDGCKSFVWGTLLTVFVTAIFITSVASLIATFEANNGANSLPGALENISDDVQTYLNNTKDSIEELLVEDATNIQSDIITRYLEAPENNLTTKFDNLEALYNNSKENIELLFSLCKERDDCSKMLENSVEIDNYLNIDIGEIRLFRRELEKQLENNPSQFTEKLSKANKEISEKLGNIQSVIESISNTILSNSPAYQKYIHYVFIGGLVLVSTLFLLLLIYVFGIFLITFGASPTETDKCGSNKTTGGKFLISSVYLTVLVCVMLFLLAGVSLLISYWGRLGVCKPLQDTEDSFLFDNLDNHIPYLANTNTSSVDILQRCHQNQSILAAFPSLGINGGIINPDEIDFDIEINVMEFKAARKTIEKIQGMLRDIKDQITIEINDEISELMDLQNSIKETEELVAKILAGDKMKEQIIEIAEDVIKSQMDDKIGTCAPVSTSFNSTVVSICRNIIEPVTAFWFSIQWSIILILISIPLAVMLANLSKYKDEYDGPFNNDIEMEQRVTSHLGYRASRLYT